MTSFRSLKNLDFENSILKLFTPQGKKRLEISFHHLLIRCFFTNNPRKTGCYSKVLLETKLLNPSYLNVRKQYQQNRLQKFVIKPVSESKLKGLSHSVLLDELIKCQSVSEQIDHFDSFVKLPDDESIRRSSICRKLEEILRPYYSSCTVYLVGSSVNGLGLKGCDVDLSLQHPHVNKNETQIHGSASFLEEISEGNLPKRKLYDYTPKVQLSTIRKIMQELKFEEPITVIPGRCPILNFCYNNLSCDLAINNRSALHGTNLMLLCGKLDKRVPTLVRIINYWAKHYKLVGGITKFKSYAMFLLVVYFLQTRNPPILPPVEEMFEKTEFMINLNNWSYNIKNFLDAFKPSENTQSIEELLREFFFFYGNFDFNYIICPISSSLMERKAFASEIDCVNNFVLNSMCIQDPINLSWNVTTEVGWKILKNFLKSTVSVCEMYQNSEHWTLRDTAWGLASLIDGKFSYQNLQEIKELTIDIPLCAENGFESHNQKDPSNLAANTVYKVLNHCLLFPCYPVSPTFNLSLLDIPANVKAAVKNHFLSGFKKNVMENNQNVSEVSHYLCATKDTWLGRNTFSVSTVQKYSLETEHEISRRMDSVRRGNDKELFYFLCSVCSEKSHIKITLRPLNSNRFIPKLAIFLKEYVPSMLQKCRLDS